MTVADRLAVVRERVARAAERSGRAPDAVTLVAVSKKQPAAAVREAFAAGQRVFGENYVQELMAKQRELADLPLAWHLVGRLQRNKAKDVAGRVAMFHALDSAALAEALARRAAAPLDVLVQVNVAGETTKAGVAPAALPALLDAIPPRLRCVGLMTMPPPARTPDDNRPYFRTLAGLAATHRLAHLSMGMTDDFEVAIEEGATLVRIGTAIFGPR